MPRAKTACKLAAPNFSTLGKAFDAHRVALMEARRRSDGKVVALLCAVNGERDGSVSFVPFAEMLQGNPYKQYDPPNPNGGFRGNIAPTSSARPQRRPPLLRWI